jgi:hypothetical protein
MRTTAFAIWSRLVLVLSLSAVRSVEAAEPATKDPLASLTPSEASTVQYQFVDWWGFWLQQNDTAAVKLRSEFDQAWAGQRDARQPFRRSEEIAAFNRRYELSRALFLCTWKQTHSPQPNPKPLFICNKESTVAAQMAQQEDARRRAAAQRAADAQEDARREAADNEAKFNAEIGQLPNEALCAFYQARRYQSARAELILRHALTADEWHLIDSGTVKVGMSELALLCTMGAAEVNRTVTAAGTRKQYVYSQRRYVYVENGRVVAFQD